MEGSMAFIWHAVPPEGPSSNLSRSTNHLPWPQVDCLDSRRYVAIELTVELFLWAWWMHLQKSRFDEAWTKNPKHCVHLCPLSYRYWSVDAKCWLCLYDCDMNFLANHFEEINVSFVAPCANTLRPGTAKASQAHPHCALLSGAWCFKTGRKQQQYRTITSF